MTSSVLGIETNQVKKIDPICPERKGIECENGVNNERQ